MIWGDVKVECHSTDDNYWSIIGQGPCRSSSAHPLSQAVCSKVQRPASLPSSDTRVAGVSSVLCNPSGSTVLSAALTALVCTLCLQVSAGSQPACTGEAAGRAAGNGKADMPTVVSTAIPGPDLEANFRLMATIQRQCCSPSTFQT